MRVLVTGGGGFAGRHLLRELLADPENEVAATTLGEIPEFDAGELPREVEWFSLDVTSDPSVDRVILEVRPDQIFHLAGQASVGRSFAEPIRTWDINATGTLRLMAALGKLPRTRRRVVLASSAEVYGEVAAEEQPISEDSAIHPITPYGVSKAAAELVSLQMGQLIGAEVVVARSFNHIGPGQDERFVLPSVSRQLASIKRGGGESGIQVGNLDVRRDFLHVKDVARAYVILMKKGNAGEAYNVCSESAPSLQSVLERLVEISGIGARLKIDAERLREVDVPLLVGDARKLRSLGWEPMLDLDEALHDLLHEAESRV